MPGCHQWSCLTSLFRVVRVFRGLPPPSEKLVFIRAIRGSASALLAPGFWRLLSGPKHHYRLRTLSREAQFLLIQKIFYQHLSPPS
jgi:hypothetical protein